MPTYRDIVIADAPVGYWPLDEAAGSTFADLGPYGLDGTLDTTDTPPALGADGVVPSLPDTACQFAGKAPGLSLARVTGVGTHIDDTDGQSIEFWATIDADSDGGIWSWFHYGPSGVVPYSCFRSVHSSYPLFSETDRHANFGGDQPASGTHHVVFTRKTGGSFKQYLDGALFASVAAGTYVNVPDLLIGGDDVSTDPRGFVGKLGHVALYNTELTQGQVLLHAAAGFAGLPDTEVPETLTPDEAEAAADLWWETSRSDFWNRNPYHAEARAEVLRLARTLFS